MRITILFLMLAAVMAGCKQESTEGDGLYIVTTTGMIADAVKNVVGDKAEVEALMGPGVDPHLYKTSQGDLAKLRKADATSSPRARRSPSSRWNKGVSWGVLMIRISRRPDSISVLSG